MNTIFTVGDLRRLLAQVPLNRRRAIMFCLDSGMTPNEAVTLTWKKALNMPLSPMSRAIVMGQPRHLRLTYVFWEYLENACAAPLFDLEDTMMKACHRDFDTMLDLYSHMVMLDEDAEREDFIRVFAATK